MAKSQVVEDKDLDHLIKVTRVTSGSHAARNVALVYSLFGTGLMPSELARLRVDDFLIKSGAVLVETVVRPEISFNARPRPLMWVNKSLVAALNAYLDERVEKRWRLGVETEYKGLDPASPLFLAKGGDGFSFRVTERNGKRYEACTSLTNLLNKLMAGAGLDGCNTGSGRRTMAVKLHRQRIDLRTINEILGQVSLRATQELCQGDPVRLSELVRRII